MSGRIIGPPTVYRDILFRSRAAACYACFFDLVDWGWDYEPITLNGYIPTFLLMLDRPLLVEVKGAIDMEQLGLFRGTIQASCWEHEALLFGAEPLDGNGAGPILGELGERDGDEWVWGPARTFVCTSCGKLSVLAEDGSWRCRCCGVDDGNEHVGRLQEPVLTEWSLAQRRVEYFPAWDGRRRGE